MEFDQTHHTKLHTWYLIPAGYIDNKIEKEWICRVRTVRVDSVLTDIVRRIPRTCPHVRRSDMCEWWRQRPWPFSAPVADLLGVPGTLFCKSYPCYHTDGWALEHFGHLPDSYRCVDVKFLPFYFVLSFIIAIYSRLSSILSLCNIFIFISSFKSFLPSSWCTTNPSLYVREAPGLNPNWCLVYLEQHIYVCPRYFDGNIHLTHQPPPP